MAKRIKYLRLTFDQQIQAYQLKYFRAAVIEKTGRVSDLFHNHKTDNSFAYRYPLIQYKIRNRKPCMVCLQEATDDIHQLLRHEKYDFQIGNHKMPMQIEEALLRYESIAIGMDKYSYSLLNYLALNQDNYRAYQAIEGLIDKLEFLQKILKIHLSTFATAMELDPSMLHVKLLELKSEKHIEYKGVFHLTFCLNFECNINLPNYIGVGKGVSLGFGVVKQICRKIK